MSVRIDIHCHTFNGADLPVEGFVKHVVLRDKNWPVWVKERLARWADRLVQGSALGFEPENTMLDRRLRQQDRWLVEPEADDAVMARFQEQVRQDAADLISADPATANYLGLATDETRWAFERPDVHAFIKFARNLASTRLDIATRLVLTYPDVTVFTPMLVDMAYGVDDCPLTTVNQQIELHEKVSRLSVLGRLTHLDALLLPFVGFDPRRELDSPGALELVMHAIEERGYAGIKMYPPMGFSPIGNEEPGVDGVLTKLYRWCADKSVPVTVHCNRSQGAKNGGNDERSDPARWGDVLSAYPSLHLNLGHFGGSDVNAGRRSGPTRSASSRPGSKTSTRISVATPTFLARADVAATRRC